MPPCAASGSGGAGSWAARLCRWLWSLAIQYFPFQRLTPDQARLAVQVRCLAVARRCTAQILPDSFAASPAFHSCSAPFPSRPAACSASSTLSGRTCCAPASGSLSQCWCATGICFAICSKSRLRGLLASVAPPPCCSLRAVPAAGSLIGLAGCLRPGMSSRRNSVMRRLCWSQMWGRACASHGSALSARWWAAPSHLQSWRSPTLWGAARTGPVSGGHWHVGACAGAEPAAAARPVQPSDPTCCENKVCCTHILLHGRYPHACRARGADGCGCDRAAEPAGRADADLEGPAPSPQLWLSGCSVYASDCVGSWTPVGMGAWPKVGLCGAGRELPPAVAACSVRRYVAGSAAAGAPPPHLHTMFSLPPPRRASPSQEVLDAIRRTLSILIGIAIPGLVQVTVRWAGLVALVWRGKHEDCARKHRLETAHPPKYSAPPRIIHNEACSQKHAHLPPRRRSSLCLPAANSPSAWQQPLRRRWRRWLPPPRARCKRPRAATAAASPAAAPRCCSAHSARRRRGWTSFWSPPRR